MQNSLRPRAKQRAWLALFALASPMAAWSQSQSVISPLMYFNGSSPVGRLNLGSDGALYGTGSESGFSSSSQGLHYRLDTNAGGVQTIYEYGRLGNFTGARPRAGMLLAQDGNFYGTTTATSIDTLRGIVSGTGTVFRMSQNGQSYTRLIDFPEMTRDSRGYLINATGALPNAALVEGAESDGQYVYGTTFQGGNNGTGTIFKIRTDGQNFKVLHHFAEIATKPDPNNAGGTIPDTNPEGRLKNADGVNPDQRLYLHTNGMLYGVTTSGGINGTGVVFKIPVTADPTDGSDLAAESFAPSPPTIEVADPPHPDFGKLKLNRTGAYPRGGLTLANNKLYGTTTSHGGATADGNFYGGDFGYGTIYAIDPEDPLVSDATFDIESILSFTGDFGATPGSFATGDLTLAADGTLLGTTLDGGLLDAAPDPDVSGDGVVFKFNPTASGTAAYSVLAVFPRVGVDTAAGDIGGSPTSVIEAPGGALYGIASAGGRAGQGLVFKFGTPPTNGPLGIPPPFDDGSSGAFDIWMVAALALLLLAMISRRQRIARS